VSLLPGVVQVLLEPDFVSFFQPGLYFMVQFVDLSDLEVMNVISGGERLDLGKSRVFKPSRQYNVSVEAIGGQLVYSGKDHSCLETDPCLRGSKDHRSQFPDHLFESEIERDRVATLPLQEVLDGVLSA